MIVLSAFCLLIGTVTTMAMRTALVTGSTDGIGLHTATRLVKEGWRVLVHGRSESRVSKAVSDLTAIGDVKGFTYDISTRKGAMGLSKEVLSSEASGIDVLINNAGVFEESMTVTEENLELTFAVNVQAPFIITRELLPSLAKKKGSRIINISSISMSDGPNTVDWDNLQFSEGGWSPYASYGISKRLMAMFSMELASRIGAEGPTVCSCDPGTVNTKMLLAGWGRCGIEIQDANTQFNLATMDPPPAHGEYYVGPRPSIPHKDVKVAENRAKLWDILENLTA